MLPGLCTADPMITRIDSIASRILPKLVHLEPDPKLPLLFLVKTSVNLRYVFVQCFVYNRQGQTLCKAEVPIFRNDGTLHDKGDIDDKGSRHNVFKLTDDQLVDLWTDSFIGYIQYQRNKHIRDQEAKLIPLSSQMYSCPICSTVISGSQLIGHLKRQHFLPD